MNVLPSSRVATTHVTTTRHRRRDIHRCPETKTIEKRHGLPIFIDDFDDEDFDNEPDIMLGALIALKELQRKTETRSGMERNTLGMTMTRSVRS